MLNPKCDFSKRRSDRPTGDTAASILKPTEQRTIPEAARTRGGSRILRSLMQKSKLFLKGSLNKALKASQCDVRPYTTCSCVYVV